MESRGSCEPEMTSRSASASDVMIGRVARWCSHELSHMSNQPTEAQRIAAGVPRQTWDFSVDDGWSVRSAVSYVLGETGDSVGVLALFAELVAAEIPVGAVAGAGSLNVGALATGLPAAGEHDSAVYGCALLTVDVLSVGEPQGLGVLACKLQPAA
jgi:hypothetical protein